MSKDILCYNCSGVISLQAGSKVGRHEECPSCYANIRSCKMCQFYDVNSYNECREPMANRIVDKESANFCDFYKLGNGGDAAENKDALKAAADALFKS